MEQRTYNPLNEGYSGKADTAHSHIGKPTEDHSAAPKNVKPLQSAIITKPATEHKK